MKKNIVKLIGVLTIVVLALLFLKYWQTHKTKTNKKNIVLIVSDSLRYDVLGFAGGDAKTPNIDWLANNGSTFVNAYSTSPRTLPSSVSMLTGNNPARYPYKKKNVGIRERYFVPDSEYLFAEFLKDEGYEVMAFATNPNSYISNNMQGFVLQKEEKKISLEQEGRLMKIIGRTRDYLPYHKVYSLMDKLLNTPEGDNFFYLLWIKDPHVPYDPPVDYQNKINIDSSQLPRSYKEYTWVDNFLEYTKLERKYSKALYLREVESMDERVGLIITALKKKGLLDETIIVFTADHGEHFGEHHQVGHGGSYYQELLHVPLLVAGPGIPKGKRINSNVSLTGLMTTLNDILGFDFSRVSAGESFKQLFDGDNGNTGPQYFSGIKDFEGREFDDALLLGNYKIITTTSDSTLLFNLTEDPGEDKNVAVDYPEVLSQMRGDLDKHCDEMTKSQKMFVNKMGDKLNFEKKENAETINRLKSLGYIQ